MAVHNADVGVSALLPEVPFRQYSATCVVHEGIRPDKPLAEILAQAPGVTSRRMPDVGGWRADSLILRTSKNYYRAVADDRVASGGAFNQEVALLSSELMLVTGPPQPPQVLTVTLVVSPYAALQGPVVRLLAECLPPPMAQFTVIRVAELVKEFKEGPSGRYRAKRATVSLRRLFGADLRKVSLHGKNPLKVETQSPEFGTDWATRAKFIADLIEHGRIESMLLEYAGDQDRVSISCDRFGNFRWTERDRDGRDRAAVLEAFAGLVALGGVEMTTEPPHRRLAESGAD